MNPGKNYTIGTSGPKFTVKQVQTFLSSSRSHVRTSDDDSADVAGAGVGATSLDPLAVRTRAVVICILFGGTTVKLSVLRRMTYGGEQSEYP